MGLAASLTSLSDTVVGQYFVLLWHYGAIPCDRGDVRHFKLKKKKTRARNMKKQTSTM